MTTAHAVIIRTLLAACLLSASELPAQQWTVRFSSWSNGFSSGPALPGGRLTSSLGQTIVQASSGPGYIVAGGFLPAIDVFSGSSTTTAVAVQDGWNLVSVPLTVNDYTKTTLFPTASSNAFAYQSGYVAQPILANGRGYWLKFGSGQIVSMTGPPRTLDSVDVSAGWNLVGSISSPVPVSSIGSVPAGIITTQFFGYGGGGYAPAVTIDPGKGYWVKTNQIGKLILSSSSSRGARITIAPTSELPPGPPGSDAVIAQDLPHEYSLEQNYPNPFNPLTTITFAIPEDDGDVRGVHATSLQVFDLLGRRVVTLVNGPVGAGLHAVTFDASGLASGTYVYRLNVDGRMFVRKMLLVR